MELLIENGGTNQGEVWGRISIIGLTDDGVRSFGRISTFNDDCNNPYGGNGGEAIQIATRAKPEPVFYRKSFHRSCTEGAKWQPARDWQRSMLEEERDHYRHIREDSP